MKPKDLALFRDSKARAALEESSKKHRITVHLLEQLLDIQRQYAGSGRQAGITSEFDSVLGDFLETAGDK